MNIQSAWRNDWAKQSCCIIQLWFCLSHNTTGLDHTWSCSRGMWNWQMPAAHLLTTIPQEPSFAGYQSFIFHTFVHLKNLCDNWCRMSFQLTVTQPVNILTYSVPAVCHLWWAVTSVYLLKAHQLNEQLAKLAMESYLQYSMQLFLWDMIMDSWSDYHQFNTK